MTAPVTLLMAIHSHQPVGNFGFVFEEAFAKSYDPFLRVLERHPGVRLALHYSGPLLDWLTDNRPEFLERVRALARRGQVELLASGYYEPILPLIPERDRQGQIRMMRQALKARFGDPAEGLWLTERVWEPDLPGTLARAGIRYTMVDTNQFAPARPWLPASLLIQDERFWDALGYYATEHSGLPVFLFPASKRLRYTMPFAQVHDTIDFLRRLRRDEPVAITFADDGEKFGLWPKTHDWVYGEGWLEQFFSAVEREASWLSTTTFRDYVTRMPPSGQVYLPSGSYEEMLDWSGGHFRNFFTKYPEASAMEQKMLRVSRSIAELQDQSVKGRGLRAKGSVTPSSPSALHPSPSQREALLRDAERALYAGQCNCAYWHGVFGGLYLGHLRRAVYTQLLSAERLAARAAGNRVASLVEDADGDGQDELAVRTPDQALLVDPDEGGTIVEWSLYGPAVNLLDTLSRRPEPYHEKLRSAAAHAQAGRGEAPPSIHDALGAKEAHLDDHLLYDSQRRSAFIDYAFQSMPTLEEARRSTWTERRLWPSAPFRLLPQPRRGASEPVAGILTRELPGGGRIRKTVRVPVDEPGFECVYETDADVPVVALEFNLSLRDERYLRAAGEVSHASEFAVEEPGAGVGVRLSIDPPATLYHFPVETVSESEQGMERTYQGLAVICLWSPPGGRAWRCRVQWTAGTGAAPRKRPRARR